MRVLVIIMLAGFELLRPAVASESSRLPEPTAEELKMTAQPEVPGAAAVTLYYEDATDSLNNNFTIVSSTRGH